MQLFSPEIVEFSAESYFNKYNKSTGVCYWFSWQLL